MEVDDIIKEIKSNGFLTRTQISLRLNGQNIKKAIEIISKDVHIHKVKYTNKFIEKYTSRELYLYNPNRKKAK